MKKYMPTIKDVAHEAGVSVTTVSNVIHYNRNTAKGLHTTSIAAAWMNIVYGFGGLRSDSALNGEGGELILNPSLPRQWAGYEFRIFYRSVHIRVKVSAGELALSTDDQVNKAMHLVIYGKPYNFDSNGLRIPLCTA